MGVSKIASKKSKNDLTEVTFGTTVGQFSSSLQLTVEFFPLQFLPGCWRTFPAS